MTTELVMRRKGAKLEVVDQMSAEDLASLPLDKDLLVTVRAPRNPRQHRLAWALANKLSQCCDFLPDAETAMDYLKIKARHVKIVHNPGTNHVFLVPKSIAFASVDQSAFNRLFNRMVWVVCNEIVPGLDEGQLRDEIEAMCAGTPQHQREPA